MTHPTLQAQLFTFLHTPSHTQIRSQGRYKPLVKLYFKVTHLLQPKSCSLRDKRFHRQWSQQQVCRLVCQHWLASPPLALRTACPPRFLLKHCHYCKHGSCTHIHLYMSISYDTSAKTRSSKYTTKIWPLRLLLHMLLRRWIVYVCLSNVLGTNWAPTDRFLFMQIHSFEILLLREKTVPKETTTCIGFGFGQEVCYCMTVLKKICALDPKRSISRATKEERLLILHSLRRVAHQT